jgi:hypothetical protein
MKNMKFLAKALITSDLLIKIIESIFSMIEVAAPLRGSDPRE